MPPMTAKTRFRLLLCACVAFLGMAVVAPAQAFDPTQVYVDGKTLAPQLLPPPPQEGDALWRKQVDAVIAAQKKLSPEDIKAIRSEQNLRLDVMASAIGADFRRDKLPKTFAMLDRVTKATAKIVEADKQYWHTRRPYLTDDRVKLLVDPINDSPSYPSGHTATARVWAEVLGQLYPEKLSVLRARADAVARHRIEAGVHYPVDIDGGRTLAALIVGALMSNEFFQDELITARKEIAGEK